MVFYGLSQNTLHQPVCAGTKRLPVQQQIARDWQALYKRVYGTAPA